MLTLREVGRHPQGASALQQLRKVYVITEAEKGLMLTQKSTDFRLFLYDMDEVIGAARRLQEPLVSPAFHQSSNRNGRQDADHCQAELQKARQRITELEERIVRLRADGAAVVTERDQWRRRAMDAENDRSHANRTGSSSNDKRYASLRRFLAKQFHPDHAPGNGIEKMIRSEVFKEVWVEIDRIDAQHR